MLVKVIKRQIMAFSYTVNRAVMCNFVSCMVLGSAVGGMMEAQKLPRDVCKHQVCNCPVNLCFLAFCSADGT